MNDSSDPLARYLATLPGESGEAGAASAEAIDRLRQASLFVIGEASGEESAGDTDRSAASAVRVAQLRQGGDTIVPVFSSEEILRSFCGDGSPAMEIEGSALFGSCGEDATFVINPGAAGSLTLTAAEFAGGVKAQARAEDPPLERSADPTPPPARPPAGSSAETAKLLLALRDALADCPTVIAGYAGNFVAEGRDRTVVGLDLERESDPDPVVARVSDALEGVGPADVAVDLVLMDRNPGPLTDALRNGEPFYRR